MIAPNNVTDLTERTGSLLVAADLVLSEVEEVLADLPAGAPEHEVDDVRDQVERVQGRFERSVAQLGGTVARPAVREIAGRGAVGARACATRMRWRHAINGALQARGLDALSSSLERTRVSSSTQEVGGDEVPMTGKNTHG